MSDESSRPANTLLVFALTALVALLPLQWVAFWSLAGRSIKPAHLAGLAVGVVAFFSDRRGRRLVASLRAARGFAACYVAYLWAMALALLWTPDTVAGGLVVARDAVHFAVYLLVASGFATLPPSRLRTVVRWAVPLGLAAFFALVSAALAVYGANFFTVTLAALRGGNSRLLQFGLYPMIFQGAAGGGARHLLVGSFVLYLCLLGALSRGGWRVPCSALLVFLVLTSVSRSSILALGCVVAVVFGIQLLRARGRVRWRTIGWAAAGTAAAVVAVVVAGDYLAGSVRVIGERFGGLAESGRVVQYTATLARLDDRLLIGHGVGAEVTMGAEDGRIHNLFLAAWYEAGPLGLLAAVGFYGALVLAWARRSVAVARGRWHLEGVAPEWVMALPVLPLVRPLVSGGGGALSLTEWLCLAAFFGILAAEKRAREAAQRARRGDGPGGWGGAARAHGAPTMLEGR